ncbi:MAG: hypothetical protein K0R98_85 [Rickettsiaceae bacterium]|jgi:hypothetical protein|nr:hypothetical protein [Rickettsiaceae bacterium]
MKLKIAICVDKCCVISLFIYNDIHLIILLTWCDVILDYFINESVIKYDGILSQ